MVRRKTTPAPKYYAAFQVSPEVWARFKARASSTGTPNRALLETMVRDLIESGRGFPNEAASAPTMRATVAGLSPETGEAVRLEALRRGVKVGHVFRLALERALKDD